MTLDLRLKYKPLLSVADVMEITGLSRNSVYTMIQNGALPSCRIGARTIKVRRDEFLRQVGLLPESEPEESEA